MEATISKAQIEVWEWKERAWELIKDIPKEKRIEFILKSVQDTVAEIRKLQNMNKVNE